MSPLIGNPYVIGDTTGNFKKLDDISSYTLTFNPSSNVSTSNDTITSIEHRFITGQRVTYTHGGGTAIGGLTSGTAYYIVNNGADTIKLASTYENALISNTINLTSTGSGSSHTINLAFDSINTRFRATYSNGGKARITNASQLTISINGVLQQPYESATPENGYGIEHSGIIVFSIAPTGGDVFWGTIIANNFPTYDITDNKVDNFTGNGSLTEFTLSKTVPNNESLLVTIDGVTQYPSDGTTTRSYTIYDSILTFTEAPANGAVIQARHIGFAGAVTSAVTGFYGRTGNVGLRTGDPLVGVGIQSGGTNIGTGVTQINFIGVGNTFSVVGNRVDVSIQGGGGATAGTRINYPSGGQSPFILSLAHVTQSITLDSTTTGETIPANIVIGESTLVIDTGVGVTIGDSNTVVPDLYNVTK
jgi:hypothetical protein